MTLIQSCKPPMRTARFNHITENDMKTYVLTLSKVFPKTHKRAGEETEFEFKFVFGGNLEKKHTIRANYPLWEYRISEVQKGRAVISLRQWTGKPYRSPQVEICKLTAEDGVGIQMLKMIDLYRPTIINGHKVELPDLAANDGLAYKDWVEWFKGYDLREPMAIIHFTRFRY